MQWRESIECLVNEFVKNPQQFTREQLLHYKFHDILCGKTSLKSRWEYPTKEFYARNGGTLKTDTESSHKARYDLALIDESREEIPFAFEFKLDIDGGSKNIGKDFFREHIRNDYEMKMECAPQAHTSHHDRRSPAPQHLKEGYTAKQDRGCATQAPWQRYRGYMNACSLPAYIDCIF